MSLIAITCLCLTIPQFVAPPTAPPEKPWTLLVYGAADNNADGPILFFLDSVRRAIDDDAGIEVLLLIDRHAKYSTDAKSLGEDFTGTRLYRLHAQRAERLAGGSELPEISLERDVELDTADPALLGRFIAFGKARAPAKQYALMIYSHADGITMCPDEDSQRSMGITDLTRVVDRSRSVDFLALELCNMGGIEIAYQWRPGTERFGADVLVAIPNAGPPLDWDRAFARIRTPGHASAAAEPHLDPARMSAADFGRLVIEEAKKGRESAKGEDMGHESAACYDLREAVAVKEAVDGLVQRLTSQGSKNAFLKARGSESADRALSYGGSFVDLYDLCRRASSDLSLEPLERRAAETVMEAVDRFVISSFGMSAYPTFEAGKSGVFIVFPGAEDADGKGVRWKSFDWYTPRAVDGKKGRTVRWAFLSDGALRGNHAVENWYELLDSWLDPDPEGTGGLNGYRW